MLFDCSSTLRISCSRILFTKSSRMIAKAERTEEVRRKKRSVRRGVWRTGASIAFGNIRPSWRTTPLPLQSRTSTATILVRDRGFKNAKARIICRALVEIMDLSGAGEHCLFVRTNGNLKGEEAWNVSIRSIARAESDLSAASNAL